jgi:hypothetical protein
MSLTFSESCRSCTPLASTRMVASSSVSFGRPGGSSQWSGRSSSGLWSGDRLLGCNMPCVAHLLQLFVSRTKLTSTFPVDHLHIPSPPSPLFAHRPSLPYSFPYRFDSIRYSPRQYISPYPTPPSFRPVILARVPIRTPSGLLMYLTMI